MRSNHSRSPTKPIPRLNEVSLDVVAPGEIVVILGANGAGKSTLAARHRRHLRGEDSRGCRAGWTIALSTLSSDQIVETGVALVPEGRGIFGDLTVRENLMLGAYTPRARADERPRTSSSVMGLFPKLGERLGQVARTMSGGEQQMVAIGRAMMSAPQILMLDEPSLGLSPLLCKELFQNLAQVKTSWHRRSAGRAECETKPGDRGSGLSCWRIHTHHASKRPPRSWRTIQPFRKPIWGQGGSATAARPKARCRPRPRQPVRPAHQFTRPPTPRREG